MKSIYLIEGISAFVGFPGLDISNDELNFLKGDLYDRLCYFVNHPAQSRKIRFTEKDMSFYTPSIGKLILTREGNKLESYALSEQALINSRGFETIFRRIVVDCDFFLREAKLVLKENVIENYKKFDPNK